ncbi:alpha/beta hydrolase [Gracilibacillus sp. YIM 98692]|uniref:alpha/beta hydrolase n=1 Tax=Gracilibacillus sp. YIM 98692 TaxID=2663532 RepID=UPI0013D27BD0|nr:alpha/beta hydrolase [Gracilibacillus sp. YIM 98692]
MSSYSFWLDVEPDISIYVRRWNSFQPAKAVIQIAHGMTEHIGRYQEFAQYLMEKGFIVYGNDHRGHGKTADKTKEFGFFAEKEGFEKVTHDLVKVTGHIKEEYPDLPVYLIGHSMGSFLVRRYITLDTSNIAGAILLGTGSQPSFLLKAGKQLANIMNKQKGNRSKGDFMNKLTFFGYNKRFLGNTPFDWLNSDKNEIKKYMEDEYCGFVPTNQFFYDLYSGMEKIQSKKVAKSIPRDFPLLFISGKEDPVGHYGKGVQKAVDFYKKNGMASVELRLLPSLRHELLNEKSKYEIFDEIISWILGQNTCYFDEKSL